MYRKEILSSFFFQLLYTVSTFWLFISERSLFKKFKCAVQCICHPTKKINTATFFLPIGDHINGVLLYKNIEIQPFIPY